MPEGCGSFDFGGAGLVGDGLIACVDKFHHLLANSRCVFYGPRPVSCLEGMPW